MKYFAVEIFMFVLFLFAFAMAVQAEWKTIIGNRWGIGFFRVAIYLLIVSIFLHFIQQRIEFYLFHNTGNSSSTFVVQSF